MLKFIHEVHSEVEPDGAPDFPSDSAGAFVNTYVSAENLDCALRESRAALRERGYRVITEYWVFRIDLEEYVPSEGKGVPSAEDLAETLSSDGFLFGAFHTYPFEES